MIPGRRNSLSNAAVLEPPASTARRRQRPADYPTIPKPLFALFLVYVVFFYLQGGYRFEQLGRIRFEFILGSLLILASVIYLHPKGAPKLTTDRSILRWMMALLGCTAIMSLLSYAPGISWNLFVDRVVKFAMMVLFISSLVKSPSHLRWFLGAYLLAFLKMAQEGVLGFFTGSLVWENQGVPRLHGATPSYAHPNSFSGTQLGTLPFIRFLVPLTRKPWNWVLLAQAAAAILIIVTTGSRTGYVAAALYVLFMLLQSRSKLKSLLIAIVAVLAALPMIPESYLARFDSIFTQKEIEGASIDTRKQIYEDAWQIFLDHPLGVGVGAFSTVRQATYGREQATHELYLEIACDLGIQGLILFMGLVFAMLRSARRTSAAIDSQLQRLDSDAKAPQLSKEQQAKLESHRSDLKLIGGTAQAVFQFLIIRLGLGLFGHDFYEIYWWFAAGLLIALHRMLQVAEMRTKQFEQLATS